MGITIFKISIWGGISSDIRRIRVLLLSLSVTVKLNLRPYIQQYTAQNDNFEYSNPLSNKAIFPNEEIAALERE